MKIALPPLKFEPLPLITPGSTTNLSFSPTFRLGVKVAQRLAEPFQWFSSARHSKPYRLTNISSEYIRRSGRNLATPGRYSLGHQTALCQLTSTPKGFAGAVIHATVGFCVPLLDGLSINWGDVVFYKDQHSSPVPLLTLLWNIARWIVINDIAIPCRVRAPFNPPALYQFPGTDFYTPIHAMYVRMEPYRLGIGHEIDVPPKLEKYVYSDVSKEKIYEFPAKDLPKVT